MTDDRRAKAEVRAREAAQSIYRTIQKRLPPEAGERWEEAVMALDVISIIEVELKPLILSVQEETERVGEDTCMELLRIRKAEHDAEVKRVVCEMRESVPQPRYDKTGKQVCDEILHRLGLEEVADGSG